MNLDELKKLVAQGESDDLEFKEKTNSSSLVEAGKTLCSFLNREGGAVLFGVTNKGKIIGQEVTDKTKRDIAEMLRDIQPFAPVELEFLNLQNKNKVVVLSVNTPALNPPYYFRKTPYHRSGPTTEIMPTSLQEELLEAKKWATKKWEQLPAIDFTLADLDLEEIKRTVTLALERDRIPADTEQDDYEDILRNFKLLDEGQINNAAVILYGKSPFPKYPCTLRLARFRGINEDEFIDSKIVHGNVFKLARDIDDFCKRHLPIASHFVDEQMERIDEPFLPPKAIREIIYNALCHREYADYSGAINFAIYDDRIEVQNSGKLPKGITIEMLKQKHHSKPRNPIIADVFYKRGLIEQWGRGTLQVLKLCAAAGHPETEYIENESGLLVIMRSKFAMQTEFKLAEKDVVLNSRQQEILHYLKQSKSGMNVKELLNCIGVSRRTMNRELLTLKDKGKVYSTGSTNNLRWFAKV